MCEHPNEYRETIVVEDYRINHCSLCGRNIGIEKFDKGDSRQKEGDEYADENGDIQQ